MAGRVVVIWRVNEHTIYYLAAAPKRDPNSTNNCKTARRTAEAPTPESKESGALTHQ